jgi:hypothetical protein
MNVVAIQDRIYEIRGCRVMFDFDLAEMYGVETKRLKEQVRRNLDRFPVDFMFELIKEEWKELVANCDKLPATVKYNPTMPFVFTQEGVAMLSGVLRSPTAVQVNINIMRAFAYMRQYVLQAPTYQDFEKLKNKILALEERSEENLKAVNELSEDTQNSLDEIYLALSELAIKEQIEQNSEKTQRKRIGFLN